MRNIGSLAIALFVAFSIPVAAESDTDRPASCTLVATAQNDRCEVENYYTCAGAGSVAYWTEFTGPQGHVQVQKYDAKHGLIEISAVDDGFRIKAKPVADHPRDIVKSGSGQEVSSGTLTQGSSSQSAKSAVEYTYDGETRKLAGKKFHRLGYAGTVSYPASSTTFNVSGSLLYNDELDLLIYETDIPDKGGKPGHPIKLKSLSLDGQKGFGSTTPKFGCGSSSLTLPKTKAPA